MDPKDLMWLRARYLELQPDPAGNVDCARANEAVQEVLERAAGTLAKWDIQCKVKMWTIPGQYLADTWFLSHSGVVFWYRYDTAGLQHNSETDFSKSVNLREVGVRLPVRFDPAISNWVGRWLPDEGRFRPADVEIVDAMLEALAAKGRLVRVRA